MIMKTNGATKLHKRKLSSNSSTIFSPLTLSFIIPCILIAIVVFFHSTQLGVSSSIDIMHHHTIKSTTNNNGLVPSIATRLIPTRVGHVAKGSMTALNAWHSSFDDFRQHQFNDWVAEKEAAQTAGVPWPIKRPPGILPFHNHWGCLLFINDKYKIIYLRTQKVASTTVMTFFGECSGPDDPSATCLLRLNAYPNLQDLSVMEDKWNDYFVFGFSRNVWTRAISIYEYLIHAVNSTCSAVRWNDFCSDPLIVGDLCRKNPGCCPNFDSKFMYFHANDQTTCLTTIGGQWAADYIGRVEHLDEDFQEILMEINRRLPAGVAALNTTLPESENTNQVKCSDDDTDAQNNGGLLLGGRKRLLYGRLPGMQWSDVNYCTKAKFFEGRHAQCFDSISKFYSNDIQRFHSPPYYDLLL